MKLYAAQSTEKQASVLAIIETLASAAAALWLAIYWATFAPFAVSVVIAPFLLLRTRDSTAHGVRLARRFVRWWELVPPRPRSRFLIYVVGGGPIIIRTVAIASALFRDFLGCVAALPSNWLDLIARIDSSVVPRAIPGYQSKFRKDSAIVADLWDLRASLGFVRYERNLGVLYAPRFILTILIHCVLVFLPALVYRWSLKSTFWIYVPLLWVVQPIRHDRKNLWGRVKAIRDDRVVLFLSAAIIVLGGIKIRVWQMDSAFSAWWNDSTLGQFFKVYVAPDSMPVWQYASMANSVLAIAMYFAARSALQSKMEDSPWPETPLDHGLRSATACRRTLTAYTTVVLVIITLKQGFPPLGEFLPL